MLYIFYTYTPLKFKLNLFTLYSKLCIGLLRYYVNFTKRLIGNLFIASIL